MEHRLDLLNILKSVDPSKLDYQEWINVGMALKYEGYTAYDWDTWSSNDPRHKPGECYRKWDTFQGDGTTGGTIVAYAQNQGFEFPRQVDDGPGHELGWDDEITPGSLVVVDHQFLEDLDINEPSDEKWNPKQDLTRYLQTLFESTENVGYVIDTYVNEDGRHLPKKGNYDRTAGKLIEELHRGSIEEVFGDTHPDAGAWIRFNPLDGKGVKNENVTDYRYTLVESDTVSLERQNAIIRELELPVATLVYSGGKSIHAIVRVDATNKEEYKKRVRYLYDVCKKNGLTIDTQNSNESRLSRMPGVKRKGKKQFLMDTNIGKATWDEWEEWIEGVNDDLPDPEPLTGVWDNLPPLAPPLIDGVLRQGHKMLLVGPSKAGKSFALIGLTIAIAEGVEWFGWPCTKGRVLYVNLELDRASALHRFKDVYNAMGLEAKNLRNIDIWNLRGKVVPLDKLAPKLIRRAQKLGYIAIIIDPIYKVITGDENSAEQMAHFTNQFDKIANELGSAVVYCHHHSKGSQGNKSSMDRASGSGVFARDPDALIDLIELEIPETMMKAEEQMALAVSYCKYLKEHNPKYYADEVSKDDELSAKSMREHIHVGLTKSQIVALDKMYNDTINKVNNLTAWRVEGTLREYPKFPPLNLWFEYPVHRIDRVGVLQDADPEGSNNQQTWKKNFDKKKSPEDRKQERKDAIDTAFATLDTGEEITVAALAEYMGVTDKTIRRNIKEHGGYWVDDGVIGKK